MCFQASVSDNFDYIAYAKGDGKIKRRRNGEKPLRENTHHNSCERRWLQANKRKINVNRRTIQLDPFESIQLDLICICIQTVVFLSFQFNSFITFFQFYSYSHDDRYNRCTYVLLCVCECVFMRVRYNNVCTQIKLKTKLQRSISMASRKTYEMQLCETIKPAAKWKNPFSFSPSCKRI